MKHEFHGLTGILSDPVVAAAIGAIVGLRAVPGTSLIEKLVNVAASFAIAAYGGSALVAHMSIANEQLRAGIIFAVGVCGLVVLGGLFEAIKKTAAFERVVEWGLSWLPRRGSQDKGGE
jgi:hypothetical protein